MSLTLDELKAAEEGTIIRTEGGVGEEWFAVALKISDTQWSMTGHGSIYLSEDLFNFSTKWVMVYDLPHFPAPPAE